MAIVRLKYILANKTDGATITITGSWGEDTDYPKTNLYNERMSKRGGFDTAKDGEIVIDLGAAASVTTCALMNHNLSSGVTAKIQGNATDSWATPSVDETITYAANDMLEEFTSASYRYWRVSIADAGRSANDIKIGELILGLNITLTKNFEWNLQRRISYTNIQHITTGGNKWSHVLYNNKSWIMKWSQLTAAKKTLIENIFSGQDGDAAPFLMILETVPYYVRVQPVFETNRPIPVEDLESGFTTNYPVEYGIDSIEIVEETRGIV